jgi:quercetin dioxygenase-like cupin family protein
MASGPSVNCYITTNSPDGAVTHFLDTNPPVTAPQGPSLQVTYLYSALPTPSFSNDADLKNHLEVSRGEHQVSFPAAGGSAAAILHFAPNPNGEEGFLHRTNTLDYLFVLEGEGAYSVSGGEQRFVKKGDAIVQRAGWHSWKNLSKTDGLEVAAVAIGAEGAVENFMEFPKA